MNNSVHRATYCFGLFTFASVLSHDTKQFHGTLLWLFAAFLPQHMLIGLVIFRPAENDSDGSFSG